MAFRPERLAEVIKKEISDLLRQMKDPRLGFVTVTAVEVSSDLRYAKVFVSVLGSNEDQDASLKVLRGAQGFIRTELGKRIRLRYTPEVSFVHDPSIEEGTRIIQIIRDIGKGQPGQQDG
ncbi:MAG: 30S ribosome-binding factor RbfA [Bacillota bacterium]